MSAENAGSGGSRPKAIAPNGVVGMLLFVASEIMFFSGLVSAFVIARSAEPIWPPPGQPYLPKEVTAVNTAVLLLSGLALFFSNRAFRKSNLKSTKQLLAIACVLGTLFVLVQGYEWLDLIQLGLTFKSSSYGSFFYLIIGLHALHVIVALLFLYALLRQSIRGQLKPNAFWTTQVFWYFVVAVWPFLYNTIYFA